MENFIFSAMFTIHLRGNSLNIMFDKYWVLEGARLYHDWRKWAFMGVYDEFIPHFLTGT